MTGSTEAIRKLHKMVPKLKDNPDELLYGKTGYLYALLWIKKGVNHRDPLEDVDR